MDPSCRRHLKAPSISTGIRRVLAVVLQTTRQLQDGGYRIIDARTCLIDISQGAPVIQKSDFYIQESVLHPITAGAIAFAFLYVYLRIASNRSLAPNDIGKCVSVRDRPWLMHCSDMDQQRSHWLHTVTNHDQHQHRPGPRSAFAAAVPRRRLCLDIWHGAQQETRDIDPGPAIALCVPRPGAGKDLPFE
jgi:hypothetical protein